MDCRRCQIPMINGTVLLIHDDKKVCDMAKAAIKSLKNRGKDCGLLITSSTEEAIDIIDKSSDIFSIIIGLDTTEPEKRLDLV